MSPGGRHGPATGAQDQAMKMREEQQAQLTVEDTRLPPDLEPAAPPPESEEEQRGAAVIWLPPDED